MGLWWGVLMLHAKMPMMHALVAYFSLCPLSILCKGQVSCHYLCQANVNVTRLKVYVALSNLRNAHVALSIVRVTGHKSVMHCHRFIIPFKLKNHLKNHQTCLFVAILTVPNRWIVVLTDHSSIKEAMVKRGVDFAGRPQYEMSNLSNPHAPIHG